MSATTETPRKRELYKVLAGRHYEPAANWDGVNKKDPNRDVLYEKGDVVESDRPLDEIFRNKFEKCIPGVNAPIVVTDERRREVARLIDQGIWQKEDRDFLEQLSDDNFSRVIRTTASKPSKVSSPFGDDVTDDFQVAYDSGYRVFRNAAGKHQVTKKGTNSTKPLNKEPLERDQVDKWVLDYMKEK